MKIHEHLALDMYFLQKPSLEIKKRVINVCYCALNYVFVLCGAENSRVNSGNR